MDGFHTTMPGGSRLCSTNLRPCTSTTLARKIPRCFRSPPVCFLRLIDRRSALKWPPGVDWRCRITGDSSRNRCPALKGKVRQFVAETIAPILADKGGKIRCLGPDATVYDAIAMMMEKRAGALLVIADGVLVGIISERDYTRKVILQGRSSKD